MFRTYISQGQIRQKVPTSFNFDKEYGQSEFDFTIPTSGVMWEFNEQIDLTEGDQGRLYNYAPPTGDDEPGINLTYYAFNYLIGPFVDHNIPFNDISQSYWYRVIKSIPKNNFYNSLNRNTVFKQYIAALFTAAWYTESLIARIDDRFSRPPRSGYEPTADTQYLPDFNMGYEWKYAQIKIRPNTIDTAYMEIKQDKSLIMAKNELGINKSFSAIYPGVTEWIEAGRERKQWQLDITYTLNGSYWLQNIVPPEPPEDRPLYEWADKSYCYMNRNFQVNIDYDPQTGITTDIVNKINREYNNQINHYHNVGSNWEAEYTVNDIPARYRIWRKEEDG